MHGNPRLPCVSILEGFVLGLVWVKASAISTA